MSMNITAVHFNPTSLLPTFPPFVFNFFCLKECLYQFRRMFSHPILASEDDEHCVKRIISDLPVALGGFFDALEAISAKPSPPQELSAQVNILHLTIQQRLMILGRVPSSAFRQNDELTGKVGIDNELPKLIDQLRHIFLKKNMDVGSQTLLWRKRSVSLAKDCAEHIRRCSVRFPARMKWRRELVTFNSSVYVLTIVIFTLSALFACLVVVVLPATQTPVAVGLPVGCVACIMLAFTSILILLGFVFAVQSLDQMYRGSLQEYMTAGGSPFDIYLESLQGNDVGLPRWGSFLTTAMAFRGLSHSSGVQRGSSGAGAVPRAEGSWGAQANISGWKEQTRNGFYTIPYINNSTGYINGTQLDAQVVMIAFDSEFLITRWNSAAEAMTGFLQDGCVGKPLRELVQCPNGEDICEVVNCNRPGNHIKIKLRSLITAQTTLSTVVAPITDSENNKIGSILICANSQDNLREYRLYMQNYLASEASNALAILSDQGSLSGHEKVLVRSIRHFVNFGLANSTETLAREMESEWDWTSVEQLLGRALGPHIGKHEVSVDPLFPSTLCVNPSVHKLFRLVVEEARGPCSVSLQMLNLTGNVYSLAITIVLGPKCKHWDEEQLEKQMKELRDSTAGAVYFTTDGVVLHFPCQVAPILDEDEGDSANCDSDQALQIAQAKAIVNCTVNVVTAITNMVDQHSLSLILLKTLFVSLASVRERSDLEKRLSAHPCEVDVIVCDSEWMSSSRDLLVSGNHGAIVIPLVKSEALVSSEFQHMIQMPLVRKDVLQLIIEVGKTVSTKKNAIIAQVERERIFTLRQDSPWTKGKLLGRGSYGAVYEAVSDLTGGKMAVKMFHAIREGEAAINTLLNEIAIMCSVKHPNIVHYFHCERRENSVCLFMELCDGSLTDVITGRLPKPPHLTVVQIIRQVLTAIVFLHSRNILHRDIKPHNILLKGDIVKLTDFGTAVEGTTEIGVRGTFRYMAPEVYRGDPHTLSCDIWSVGCLVCELFACVPEFMGKSSLLGQMTSATEYLTHLPQNAVLRDFIQRCFQVDPRLRWGAHDLLTHSLLSGNAGPSAEMLETIFDIKKNKSATSVDPSAFSLRSA